MMLVGDSLNRRKNKLKLPTLEGCGGHTLSAYSKRKWTNSLSKSPEMVTKMTAQTCTIGIPNATAVDAWGEGEEQVTGSGQTPWSLSTVSSWRCQKQHTGWMGLESA